MTVGREVLGEETWPYRAWLGPLLFSPEFRRKHPDRVRELLPNFGAHRAQPHGQVGQLLATIYHDTVSRLPRIQAPTLVEPVTRHLGLPVGALRTGRSLIGYAAERRPRRSRGPDRPSG